MIEDATTCYFAVDRLAARLSHEHLETCPSGILPQHHNLVHRLGAVALVKELALNEQHKADLGAERSVS